MPGAVSRLRRSPPAGRTRSAIPVRPHHRRYLRRSVQSRDRRGRRVDRRLHPGPRVLKAIENGKHVVTANKALIAVHGNEIFAKAREKGVIVAFEAAVAGGIPVIKAIREGLSANRINWLAGIINGTGNFILSEMREGPYLPRRARRGPGPGLCRGRPDLRRGRHRRRPQADHPRLDRLRHSAAVRQGLHRRHLEADQRRRQLRRRPRLSHQAPGRGASHRAASSCACTRP